LSIIGLTLTRGSWWYTYGTDQALDHETRHPTDVRTCLLTAQVALEAADDPRWAEALGELRAVI